MWSDFSKDDESYFFDLDGEDLASALEKEREFFLNFTKYLEQTYEDKTFILQNWESDWKFQSALQDVEKVQKVSAWVEARQAGVSDARTPRIPHTRVSRVLHAVEVNKVVNGMRDGS